jgi:hypothetical protein
VYALTCLMSSQRVVDPRRPHDTLSRHALLLMSQ